MNTYFDHKKTRIGKSIKLSGLPFRLLLKIILILMIVLFAKKVGISLY